MKIIVTVKENAEIADDFQIDGVRVDERYLEYDLNEWDDYAIEAGVQIGEERDDVEVVAVTVGPERTEETIRIALAKGVDRAIRIWDESLTEEVDVDVRSRVRLLSAVIRDEQPDLILTGVQADDDALGATGVALADELDLGWAAVVNHLELDGDVVHVHRELEGGVDECTDVLLPAVLTIQTGINEPRYASLRGIRMAQRKEIDYVTLDDLAVEPFDSDLAVTAMYEPESESEPEFIDGDADESAAKLATILQEKGVGAE